VMVAVQGAPDLRYIHTLSHGFRSCASPGPLGPDCRERKVGTPHSLVCPISRQAIVGLRTFEPLFRDAGGNPIPTSSCRTGKISKHSKRHGLFPSRVNSRISHVSPVDKLRFLSCACHRLVPDSELPDLPYTVDTPGVSAYCNERHASV